MKLLKELLFELDCEKIIGDIDLKIESIHFNSNEVVKSSLFVASKGVKFDGHDYIVDAISRGASVVVCEDLPLNIISNITYIKVPKSSHALGLIASNFFNNPSKKIKLVGVTGTNGKTSTVYYLASLFNYLPAQVGMISTIENQIADHRFPSTHTTPDAITINQLLSDMVDARCEYCFMEVSSHAIAQNRISGLDFAIAVFTNISRDHLDYHGTFENYLDTKKSFFDQLSPHATALINKDDKYNEHISRDISAKFQEYGLQYSNWYYAKNIKSTINGLSLELEVPLHYNLPNHEKDYLIDKYYIKIKTSLVGDFNAYNLLAAYSVACELGIEKSHIQRGLSCIQEVPGRFNVLKAKDGVIGIVDYAHTPDALSKVITSIGAFCDVNKDLIIVIGCGGNRDVGKRSLMGKIAAQNSAVSIFTSDNPRFENPESIIEDMCLDLGNSLSKKIKKIIKREDAIHFAVESAAKDQIILVAGKGHENYQEIQSVRHPFDDIQILKKILKI